MVFFQPVLQAVLPITRRTSDTGRSKRVDIRLAYRMRALCICRYRGLAAKGRARCSCSRGFPPRSPFAGVAAFMGGFGSVIEAVGAAARFTAEGEEVQDVAIGVLAVGAYGFDVFVHGCEGLGLRDRGF